jgi:hypothetical protein
MLYRVIRNEEVSVRKFFYLVAIMTIGVPTFAQLRIEVVTTRTRQEALVNRGNTEIVTNKRLVFDFGVRCFKRGICNMRPTPWPKIISSTTRTFGSVSV